MQKIALTQGKFALVDDEDALWLCLEYTWCFEGRYAQTTVKREKIAMHKLIGAKMGIKGEIDHRDLDKLNNQRSNLRPATKSQNNINKKRKKNKKLPKGVFPNGKKYRARIKIEGKVTHVGTFDTIEAAQTAYWRAAKQYFGEYARKD